jgi:hypothetical protein
MRGIGFVLASALAGAAFAQGGVQSDIAVIRADNEADRQALVASNMQLSDAQATSFWPVYREYRAELGKTGDRLIKLVTDYAKSYDTLTDAQATAMVSEMMAIRKENLKIAEKFVPKFNGVLPPKMVMRYFQIENKLDTIVMSGAVDGIPLAK